MAAAAKKEDGEGAGIGGEYKRPDAAAALKIYREEIAPKKAHMATIKGDLSEPHKRIKDECNFPRKVLDFITGLAEMEDAKRDHWLLALNAGLAELRLTLPDDLVTRANGEEGGAVVPTGAREKPKLATLGGKPTDGFEATAEELAQQEGRKQREPAE